MLSSEAPVVLCILWVAQCSPGTWACIVRWSHTCGTGTGVQCNVPSTRPACQPDAAAERHLRRVSCHSVCLAEGSVGAKPQSAGASRHVSICAGVARLQRARPGRMCPAAMLCCGGTNSTRGCPLCARVCGLMFSGLGGLGHCVCCGCCCHCSCNLVTCSQARPCNSD